MNNEEINEAARGAQADIDDAEAHFKETTVGYKNKHWTTPPAGTHWSDGLVSLDGATIKLQQIIEGTDIAPAPEPPPPTLAVTQSLKAGQILSVPLEWTAQPSAAVDVVDFLIDGNAKWTEHIAPYVFNGDGGKLDPATLPNGPHMFTVVATAKDGVKANASASLSVDVDLPTPPTPPSGSDEGNCRFWMYATSQTDYLFSGGRPTQADKDWQKAHWDAIEGWLDVQSTYHPAVFRYNDMLQIYVGSSVASQHPEWILKDSAGNSLKYNTHWMADIGHPAYQDFKAQQCADLIAVKKAYGIKADDVNLDRISANAGVCINQRTKKPYTLPEWQKDNADLMTKVRAKVKAANANAKICHNSLWWASGVDVDRCIKQADYFQLERGFGDPNYTPAKIVQLWAWIDKVHSMGVGVVHLNYAGGTQGAHFNHACALLCSNGNDYVYGDGWRPESWDATYDKNYGAAKGPRYQKSTNVWARDFETKTVTADLAAKVGTLP